MIIGGKATNPGALRTKVTLYSRSVAVETGGFQTASLAKIADVWAKWTNVHGSEVWAAQSVQAQSPATVLIRYRSGIDPTCVVLKGSDYFEIVSIDNIGERSEYIELKVQKMRAG